MRMYSLLRWQGAALSALALVACGDDGGGDGPTRAPYALATTLFSPEGATTLLTLVDDPSVPATLDTSRAIEIGGAAALFGSDGQSVFAVGSSDGAVITRFEVGADGALTEGPRMSLAAAGIDSAFRRPGLVPFVSPTKAYWFDETSLQAVIWDPSAMAITGSISLAAAARDGWLLELGEQVVIRDGLAFLGAIYRGGDDLESGQAAVLVVDTATDQLVDVARDDRCGDAHHIVTAADGALYVASGALAANMHALQRPAGYPAPCLLRILPGQRGFDPAFHVALPDLVGGRSAGRLVLGPNGTAFVLALHTDLLSAPLGPETPLFDPWDATTWRWWRVALGAATPGTLDEGVPAASAAGQVLRAGGRDHLTQLDLEAGATTLLVATETGLVPGLVVPGYPYGLVRID
jgi:hypothetical protein